MFNMLNAYINCVIESKLVITIKFLGIEHSVLVSIIANPILLFTNFFRYIEIHYSDFPLHKETNCGRER